MGRIAVIVSLVAHEGGWDEILLVGVPIVLIIGVLAIAKSRVDRVGTAGEHQEPDTQPPGHGTSTGAPR